MANPHTGFHRLSNQRIIGTKFEQPEAVPRWMGALQAQDYAQAVWAIGVRTHAATLADIEQAISERKILRTWPMRGTIHFVPPEDAKWMLRISAARMVAADRRRQEQLGLNTAILERSGQLFYDALHGDRRLLRSEMLTLLENAGISADHQRGYHILWYAAQTGLICLGPMQNKQQTFVLLDDWAPNARELSREEALAELAGRYFTSHGPATAYDFAWWAGITLTDARFGLAAARKGWVSETIDGKEYWRTGEPALPAASDPQSIYLLPGFDEYLLGYTDRSAVLGGEHAQKIVPGGNGVFRPMLVIAGQVVGGWQRSLKKNSVEITVSPFIPLTVPEERLFAAAQRYTDFLGLPLSGLVIEEIK